MASTRRPRRRVSRAQKMGSDPQSQVTMRLELGDPVHGGACVSHDSTGRVVFVRNGLPGEVVIARLMSEQKKLAWADVIEVEVASPDRIDSLWPQADAGAIGGAELSHVTPSGQRRWKEFVLTDQMRRIGGAELASQLNELGGITVNACVGDEDENDSLLHRRSRVELVADKTGRLGMHRYRSHEIIPLDSMPFAVEAIGDLNLFSDADRWADAWKPRDRVRIVSSSGGDTVVMSPRGTFGHDGRRTNLTDLKWFVGFDPVPYSVRPAGFWQPHVRGAEVLRDAVMRAAALEDGQKVIELYSGAGLFTRPIAQAVGSQGRVVTLEGDEDAVADAAGNIPSSVDAYVGNVDVQGVTDLSGELHAACDVVILDPPRVGAGQDVCSAIAALQPGRIVLVSCDVASGARDLKSLTDAGYKVQSFEAWDLFPHTHHVEFVAALTR